MAYILKSRVGDDKKAIIALREIKGIGKKLSKRLVCKTGLSEESRVELLKGDRALALAKEVSDRYKISIDLERDVYESIKKKIELRSYHGYRHLYRLPVRGQRSKTNGRTRKRIG